MKRYLIAIGLIAGLVVMFLIWGPRPTNTPRGRVIKLPPRGGTANIANWGIVVSGSSATGHTEVYYVDTVKNGVIYDSLIPLCQDYMNVAHTQNVEITPYNIPGSPHKMARIISVLP